MKLIFPLHEHSATTSLMSEQEILNIVNMYLPQDHKITVDKLNYWVRQEYSWPTVKKKQVDGIGKSGRSGNAIKKGLRGNAYLPNLLVRGYGSIWAISLIYTVLSTTYNFPYLCTYH